MSKYSFAEVTDENRDVLQHIQKEYKKKYHKKLNTHTIFDVLYGLETAIKTAMNDAHVLKVPKLGSFVPKPFELEMRRLTDVYIGKGYSPDFARQLAREEIVKSLNQKNVNNYFVRVIHFKEKLKRDTKNTNKLKIYKNGSINVNDLDLGIKKNNTND